MAKKAPPDALARGERLLREWNVAEEVDALRAAWGRDPDADVAIASHLGRHAEAASASALLDLEASASSKALRKHIRRSLFRLEQRGLTIPKPAAPPPVASPLGVPEIEGYMSPSDGAGDQVLWIVKPRPQGLAQLFAVINDPEGMREVELHTTTRKALRAARDDLARKHAIPIVEVDWRYCDQRMGQAYQWAVSHGATVHGDYLGLRRQLLREPPAEVPHPIFTVLDAAAIRADAVLLAESAQILEEKEFRTWFLTEPMLRPYLDELNNAIHSPLVLNRYQQQDRAEQVIAKAVGTIFGGERRTSLMRRLLDVALVFEATHRPVAARRALATALALDSSPSGGGGVLFCEALVRMSMAAHAARAEEKRFEEAQTSLIVTPQQLRQEAMRQRR